MALDASKLNQSKCNKYVKQSIIELGNEEKDILLLYWIISIN